VVVRFGSKCPPGFLPVYSVDTKEEAQQLLVAACERNVDGEFVARELAHEQTLDNLYSFGARLKAIHEAIQDRKRNK